VLGDVFPDVRDLLPGRAAEPPVRPEQDGVRIEVDPEDAGRGHIEQLYVRRYRGPFGMTMAGLELNVPRQASIFEREVISSAIDLGPQHFEVAYIPEPK